MLPEVRERLACFPHQCLQVAHADSRLAAARPRLRRRRCPLPATPRRRRILVKKVVGLLDRLQSGGVGWAGARVGAWLSVGEGRAGGGTQVCGRV